MNLLTLVIFLPLLSIPIFLLLHKKTEYIKVISLLTFLAQLCIGGLIWFQFDSQNPELQFISKHSWISVVSQNFSFKSDYFVAIDGLNLALVLMSSFIFVISTIASWNVDKKPRAYFSLLHLLACTTIGCFVAMDLFVFFVFFEFMLLPMYFLIAIWGGPRREYASIKFFLFTLFGSLLILIVFIWLYIQTGSFDITVLKTQHAALDGLPLKGTMFLLLFVGLAIKLPAVPVHTWLPDAHVEASTPISVILASLLLKTGGYAIIRLGIYIFPAQLVEYAWLLAVVGVVSIIYAALNALAMNDLKKMIAYSSVSHMGFVLLGIGSCSIGGINGSVFQMVSHGIISGALFLIVGVIYDRVHNRSIDHFRGLAFKMPLFTTVTSIAFFASLGLPGFSGFIGEILILLGSFEGASTHHLFSQWWVIAACFGILLSAAYYLWTLQRMFFGKYWLKEGSKWSTELTDINSREKIMLYMLCFLMLLLGLVPNLILKEINVTVTHLIKAIIIP